MIPIIKLIMSSLLIILSLSSNQEDELTKEAKELTQKFGKTLKSELVKGMSAGGAENAISVCYEKAPEIAENLSQESGWIISRTSLKARNKNNTPDDWEKSVLLEFERLNESEVDQNSLVYSEVIEKNGTQVFRFMKAIPTDAVCLTCHGSNIKDEVAVKIKELYPEDNATGFKQGDIRGAFSLSKIIVKKEE